MTEKNLLSCEYKKVMFRNAICDKADELAREYLGQFNSGLITWAELGEKLVELRAFYVETIRTINEK